MTAWVDDIRKALQNLGGKASLSEIYDEVSRIRVEPLPRTWQAGIRGRLEAHSSDSTSFTGKDYFYKANVGVWGLREPPVISNVLSTRKTNRRKNPKEEPLSYVTPEQISLVLSTLKDYRGFYHPADDNWDEYIDQIFYILGFAIVKIDGYHQLIGKMGSEFSPSAVVFRPKTSQNFHTAISNIEWEDLLFFAAQHFRVLFGIITNGIKLKIIDYRTDNPIIHTWLNFDEVILQQSTPTFNEIYFILSFIRNKRII